MRRIAALLVLISIAATAPVRAAGAGPEVAFQMGRTFAVGSLIPDAFDQGGFTVSGGALWAWESRFRFGAEMFVSDFGNQVAPVTLADLSGGPPKDYGSIDFGHRGSWGAVWRVDALGPRFGGGYRGYVTGSYGFARFVQDRAGTLKYEHSGLAGSVGLGIERPLGAHQVLGLTAGATRLSDDFTRRYGSAALEWRWRW